MAVEKELFELFWAIINFFSESLVFFTVCVTHNWISQISSELNINISSLILNLDWHHVSGLAFREGFVAIFTGVSWPSDVFSYLFATLGACQVEMFVFSANVWNKAPNSIKLSLLLILVPRVISLRVDLSYKLFNKSVIICSLLVTLTIVDLCDTVDFLIRSSLLVPLLEFLGPLQVQVNEYLRVLVPWIQSLPAIVWDSRRSHCQNLTLFELKFGCIFTPKS